MGIKGQCTPRLQQPISILLMRTGDLSPDRSSWHSVYREEPKIGNLSYVVALLLKWRVRHLILRIKHSKCQTCSIENTVVKKSWQKTIFRDCGFAFVSRAVSRESWVNLSKSLLEFQGRAHSSALSPVTNSWYSTSVGSSGGPDVTWCARYGALAADK